MTSPPSSSKHHHHHRTSGSTVTATTATATHHRSQPAAQACASCKFQRRKCNPDCLLAPYFPADHQRQFINAHRLFGVSKIQKIIGDLDPLHQAHAMHSIIFESNARAADPVGGCYRVVLDLHRRIELLSAELSLILQHLDFYRTSTAAAAASQGGINHELAAVNLNLDVNNPDPEEVKYFYYDDNDNNGGNSNSINNYGNNNNGNGNVEMESMLRWQQQCGGVAVEEDEEEEGDGRLIADIFEDEVKTEKDMAVETFGFGNKVELKEHMQEHDLKGAASLFTLTNCHTSSI